MRRFGVVLAGVALMSASVLATDNPCAPVEKWVTVCETVKVEVPVVEWVDEPCEVKVTRMVPCEKEIEVCEGKWTMVASTITVRNLVTECEEYTVDVKKTEYREETRTRKVCRTVPEVVEKCVEKKITEEVCDPATGKLKKVVKVVPEMVKVTVDKQIYEDETYTVKVPCVVAVPVVKTRRVCKWVDVEKPTRTPKYVTVMVKKKVTEMVPVEETKTVMRKKKVCSTKIVEKQIQKRVKVAEPAPCPPPPCPPAPCA